MIAAMGEPFVVVALSIWYWKVAGHGRTYHRP